MPIPNSQVELKIKRSKLTVLVKHSVSGPHNYLLHFLYSVSSQPSLREESTAFPLQHCGKTLCLAPSHHPAMRSTLWTAQFILTVSAPSIVVGI